MHSLCWATYVLYFRTLCRIAQLNQRPRVSQKVARYFSGYCNNTIVMWPDLCWRMPSSTVKEFYKLVGICQSCGHLSDRHWPMAQFLLYPVAPIWSPSVVLSWQLTYSQWNRDIFRHFWRTSIDTSCERSSVSRLFQTAEPLIAKLSHAQMVLGDWSGLVLYVPFSSLILMVRLQEGHSTHKNSTPLILRGSFAEQVEDKDPWGNHLTHDLLENDH